MTYNTKEKWGPKAWNLLHSFSINNNYKIPDNKKHNYYIFYTTFTYILPCIICSDHYYDIIHNIEPLEEEKISRSYIKKWIFKVHNIVNSILNKPKYSYYQTITNNEDIFFFISNVYKNFDYDMMSLYKFDQIYNFFINFCILYPDKDIQKKLKKIIKSNNFKNIKTPNDFKHLCMEPSFPCDTSFLEEEK
jgi:hypothetical protein